MMEIMKSCKVLSNFKFSAQSCPAILILWLKNQENMIILLLTQAQEKTQGCVVVVSTYDGWHQHLLFAGSFL